MLLSEERRPSPAPPSPTWGLLASTPFRAAVATPLTVCVYYTAVAVLVGTLCCGLWARALAATVLVLVACIDKPSSRAPLSSETELGCERIDIQGPPPGGVAR